MAQQINLYNPIFLKQEKPFSARTIGCALAAVAAGLGAISAYAFMQLGDAQAVAGDSARMIAAERDRVVKLAGKLGPQVRSKALEIEVARLEGEAKSRETVLAALSTGELGNTEGFSEFMAALARQAIPGVWLVGVRIGEAGNDLEVRGRTLSPDLVPAYLRSLNTEPMMRGRRVTEMKLAAKSAPTPPAPAAGTKPAAPAGPDRFVEFTLTAPRTLAEAGKPAKGDGK